MKKFRLFILLLLIIPCSFMLTGCSLFGVYVTDIVKTDESGIYTVYYSDGSKSTVTIKDGKDASVENIDLNAMFDSFVEQGLYEDTEDGYREFIKDYFGLEETTNVNQLSINKNLQSAVSVYAGYPTTETYQNNTTYSIGAGAGVIYSMDVESDISYIITNYHVVYATDNKLTNKIANNIAIYQYGAIEDIDITPAGSYEGLFQSYSFGSNSVSCDYVGGSMAYDIAVLKVKTSDLLSHNPTACAVKVAKEYHAGETAIAIGNPNAEGISITKGIVSVESEILTMKGADNSSMIDFRVMRIDTSINGGNSGGGLFNTNGELIGIVNAKALMTSTGTNLENMAYALPIDNVSKVVDNIITNGKVKRLSLGITSTPQNGKVNYNPEDGSIYLTDELLVTEVSSGFANNCGLNPDNIITEIIINGVPYKINRYFQLKDYTLLIKAGDTVAFTVKTTTGTKTCGPETVTESDLVVVTNTSNYFEQ